MYAFKVQLTPKTFFAKTIKLILWSNLPQKFFDLFNSLIFYGASKYVKMPPFWFKQRQIENTMILRFAYLLVSVGKAGKVVQKNGSQVRCSGM